MAKGNGNNTDFLEKEDKGRRQKGSFLLQKGVVHEGRSRDDHLSTSKQLSNVPEKKATSCLE